MNFSQRFSFLLLKKPLSTGWLFSAKIFRIVVNLLLKIVDFHHKRAYNRIVKRLRETSERKTNQKRRRKMEKFQHEYEIIIADIEKTERNAERFVLLTRAIKNQKFFLRQKAKTASREELEKIDFAYGILEKVLQQGVDKNGCTL